MPSVRCQTAPNAERRRGERLKEWLETPEGWPVYSYAARIYFSFLFFGGAARGFSAFEILLRSRHSIWPVPSTCRAAEKQKESGCSQPCSTNRLRSGV